jgi:hypothetical protein
LEQAKKRAEIRIREGRAKPIDILAMNMRLANEADMVEEEVDLEVDLDEPYTIFDVSNSKTTLKRMVICYCILINVFISFCSC